jgi:hypothetical protein
MDPSNIQRFPVETQMEILSYLPRDELLNLCQVNNLWKNLCKNELLWKKLYQQDFFQNKHYSTLSWYDNYRLLYSLSKSDANNLYNSFFDSLRNYKEGREEETNIPIYNIPNNLYKQIINNLTYILIRFIRIYGNISFNLLPKKRRAQIETYLKTDVERVLSRLLEYLNVDETPGFINLYRPYNEFGIYDIIREFLYNFYKKTDIHISYYI